AFRLQLKRPTTLSVARWSIRNSELLSFGLVGGVVRKGRMNGACDCGILPLSPLRPIWQWHDPQLGFRQLAACASNAAHRQKKYEKVWSCSQAERPALLRSFAVTAMTCRMGGKEPTIER